MKKVTFLAGLIFLASVTLVQAQKGQRFNNEKPQRYQVECAIPDLTEEQETKIESLRTEHWNKMKNYRADLMILKAEMQKLQVSDNPDGEAIDNKIEAMGKIRTEMQKASNHHRLDVRKLLTEEQKAWYDSRGKRFGQRGFGSGQGRRGDGFHRGGRKGYGDGYGNGMRNRDGSCRW